MSESTPTKPPSEAPSVAVTYTADSFQGIYRGKKYHDPDFPLVLQRAKQSGVQKIILTTMSLPDAHKNLAIVRGFPGLCSMTLGVHPYHAGEIYPAQDPTGQIYLDELRALAKTLLGPDGSSGTQVVAFGEIGLDYEYLDRADKDTQQRAFRDQLCLAVEFQLPLFLHVRSSCADFIEIIQPFLPDLPRLGLVHSFAGSKEEMYQLVELGFGISVNGVSFHTEEGLEMVRCLPLDKMQLETDAPWCEDLEGDERIKSYLVGVREVPGARKHGKFRAREMMKGRNESCMIERVAMVVAGVKGVEVAEVARRAWENSVRMFRMGIY
ncbi:hypothetical protein BDW59DRAFT_179262 [Aspergillus cavernicola]|uniref:Uncharacterized protein n=1 Tax=Aspergillus cavernicola TaxID=176166 RepID=A0ABR4IIH0_9EURO